MDNEFIARIEAEEKSLEERQGLRGEMAQALVQIIEFLKELFTDVLSKIDGIKTDYKSADSDLGDRIDNVEAVITRERLEIDDAIKNISLTPGEPGKDADPEAIKEMVLAEIELPEPKEADEITPIQVRDKLESIDVEDEKLSMEAVSGLPAALAEIRREPTGKRNIFGIPSRGLFLYIGGVKKGIISNLNLVAGSGLAIAYSKVNGQDTITFTASGSGDTVETPTGTVDATNATFTPSKRPKWVVADGTTYYEGAGYTWSTPNIIMDIPPSSFIRDIIS